MKWTTDYPTVPGHYWWRCEVNGLAGKTGFLQDIAKVFVDERGLMCRAGVTLPLREFKRREWAGPIPQPEGQP